MVGSFSVGPFPNGACKFPGTRLSSDHFRVGAVARPAWMSSWQRRQITRVLRRRLAMRCIQAGLFGPAWLVEVGEFADVVDLAGPSVRLADLAAFGEEPVDQLVAPGAGHDRLLVGEDGRALAFERDPAEAGDQWLPAPIALDGDLEDTSAARRVSRSSSCTCEPSS